MRNRPQLPKRVRPAVATQQTLRRRKTAAAAQLKPRKPLHLEPSDIPIEATPEELEAIRGELGAIEKMLAALFGSAYDRGPVSMAARAKAAEMIENHFEKIVEEWCQSVEHTFEDDHALHRPGMANSLIRFVAHLRDPDDLRTYIHLRRHCQEGMLSRAKPSQFNIFHIVLKQVLLNHVHKRMRGRNMEVVRDAVVAAIDERRLMVCQFYIESRERELRASENKYRSSIDHAPDPMYEIDPESLVVIGANSAALELHRILPYEQDKPLIGQFLCELDSAGNAAGGAQAYPHRGEQRLRARFGPCRFAAAISISTRR